MPSRLRPLLPPAAGAALAGLLAVTAAPAAASAATPLAVPGAFASVQAAIDAAAPGDTVTVGPGTYREHIDFEGKAITVVSAQGPASTVIDGGSTGRVVTFAHGEGRGSVLQGFTIRNGLTTSGDGGYGGAGIEVSSASPTIRGNLVIDNVAGTDGAGIEVSFGSPAILDNVITGNREAQGWSGGAGGGIALGGAAGALVAGNHVSQNSSFWGGVNRSDATIVQNLITGNRSPSDGGGLSISTPSGTRGPLLVANTIADNSARRGSAVWAGGFDSAVRLSDNILRSSSWSEGALYCDATYSTTPPAVDHDDVFAGRGVAFAETCAGLAGRNGNLSADPRFAAPGDYHLLPGSPAIDAGDSAAPALPATDLDGHPRIAGAAVDPGVYEAQPTR